MLKIVIINDGTANTPENTATTPDGTEFCILGNYDYKIFINSELVEEGRIEEHNRISGWAGLISCLDKAINGDRFKE